MMSTEESNEYEGHFINEETGQELNVQYQSENVFITEYQYGKPTAKFVFNINKNSPKEIIEFIKSYGVIE